MKHELSHRVATSAYACARALAVVMGCCSVTVAAQGLARPDATRGAQLYEQGDAARGIIACASCHGAAGNSTLPINPNLAGQPHEYLVKQLASFKVKAGEELPQRRNAEGAPSAMAPLVVALTDEDMRNVALYLSRQPLSEAATAGKESLVEHGEKIWRAGLPDRAIPACASCHGATGAGLAAQYPRLSGQFPTYIEEQLRLFRSGQRLNDDTMRQIAERMGDRDIEAVADYAAGLR